MCTYFGSIDRRTHCCQDALIENQVPTQLLIGAPATEGTGRTGAPASPFVTRLPASQRKVVAWSTHVHRLPVQELLIDRSFVTNLSNEACGRSVSRGRCKKRWRKTTVAHTDAELTRDLIQRRSGPCAELDRRYVGDITYIGTWEG